MSSLTTVWNSHVMLRPYKNRQLWLYVNIRVRSFHVCKTLLHISRCFIIAVCYLELKCQRIRLAAHEKTKARYILLLCTIKLCCCRGTTKNTSLLTWWNVPSLPCTDALHSTSSQSHMHHLAVVNTLCCTIYEVELQIFSHFSMVLKYCDFAWVLPYFTDEAEPVAICPEDFEFEQLSQIFLFFPAA